MQITLLAWRPIVSAVVTNDVLTLPSLSVFVAIVRRRCCCCRCWQRWLYSTQCRSCRTLFQSYGDSVCLFLCLTHGRTSKRI